MTWRSIEDNPPKDGAGLDLWVRLFREDGKPSSDVGQRFTNCWWGKPDDSDEKQWCRYYSRRFDISSHVPAAAVEEQMYYLDGEAVVLKPTHWMRVDPPEVGE